MSERSDQIPHRAPSSLERYVFYFAPSIAPPQAGRDVGAKRRNPEERESFQPVILFTVDSISIIFSGSKLRCSL